MSATAPRTARGMQTRRKIIEAAEEIFAELGYTEASISRITVRAGVGQGTFYLYFDSKLELFNELVDDLNHRVRQAMSEAASAAENRFDRERAGFKAFFQFTADHPSLYRIVREAEFVSPGALRMHYTRIVEGYIDGLKAAKDAGELGDIDPTVAAWALMGIGEMFGMRWVLWNNNESGGDADPFGSGTSEMPDYVFDQMMLFIRGALSVRVSDVEKAAVSARTPTPIADRRTRHD